MKLLFVRFSALGDIILTTGVIKKFKEIFPQAQADVLTYCRFRDVFDGLDFVNKVYCYDKSSGLKSYFGLIQNELDEYDHIIDLHSKPLSMLLRFTSPAQYHRYVKDSSARRKYVKSRKDTPRLGMHVTLKYFEPLAKTFGLEMPDVEELRPALFSDKAPEKRHILIHPFASKTTKTYPFIKELAELLVQKGYTPVFAGDGKAPDVTGAIDKTGKTSIRELFDTIASCEAVITTDSGPMHIAVALNRPTVAIFGSTTKHFGFYPEFSGVKVVENNDLTCRPCHVHGLDACPEGHFRCMKSITPEMIASALGGISTSD
ncbi:MAG: glycosyltransferase family 9 protein [Deferribacterales bacterium]